ncbi:MAG TPA: hypothetical protein VFJ74_14640 [Gemmatimonadaceae bacterium]|nr:hypothetical protein [Gemmatimonadaceae bacterium]
MSDAALGIDVRLPIGGLFTALGVILGGYGAATAGDAAHYAPSLGMNVNLWWGVVMLVFGILMLLGARRARVASGVHPTAESPEGRQTEAREHRLGLEKE